MFSRSASPAARVFGSLIAIAATVWPGASNGSVSSWKGAESMALVGLAPSPERCGQPPVLEATFIGDGIDSLGGLFTVVASGCLNQSTLQMTDLTATDHFVDGTLLILPGNVTLTLDPQTCVASNAAAVPFSVGDGTGRFEGASGSGTYHLALNWAPCNGIAAPARVWFEGSLAGI